jgi:N-acetylglucosaminyl-diphospho-decaprenol L-rhamnosyltransferase
MSRQAPSVTVVVVNFNGADCLPDCLAALAGQSFRNFEAIVVDNASSDGSAREDLLPDGRFRLVRLQENTGFAAANNLGARLGRGEWLATLNPDAYPEPDWLANLIQGADRHPGTAMFASTQLLDAAPGLIDGAGDVYSLWGLAWRGAQGWPARKLPAEGRCFGPCAASAMYLRKRFLEMGGFDQDYFCYFEDVDLAFRMQLAGESCVYLPKAKVRHAGGGISPGASDFTIFHCARNRIWTYLKNMPPALLALGLPLHLTAVGLLVLGAVARGTARPEIRGIGQALRGLPGLRRRRQQVQASRRISALKLAGRLSLNPMAYLRRTPLVRPSG